MSTYLIKGGCVLTMDQKIGNLREADLLVEDGVITEIAPRLRARGAEVVDASDRIVMPGFVDTHRHVWESLFRGLGSLAGPGEPIARFGPHYSDDDIYASTLIGLLGAAEAGITTVADWADILPEHVGPALEGHADSGLRTVFAPAGGTWADTGPDWRRAMDKAMESGPAHPAAAPPAPLGDLDRLGDDWGHARESGLRIHAHAGTGPSRRGGVAEAAAGGLLGVDVTLVLGSGLDEADFDAIASAGASVSVAASAQMAMGHEPPPMQKLIDREIRTGLAVETERIAPGDMFAPMRAAISLQHATHFGLKLAGKGGLPSLLTTRQVIRYATIDGARALGLQEVTGSLTPGKEADVLVLRTDRPNISPLNDPIGAVVWGMDTSNLDWVFGAGRVLMRAGELTADVAPVRELAVSARRRVVEAAGLMAGSGEAR